METQITLNKYNEVEMIILPTKDDKIFKKYRRYAYSSKLDLIFIGIYYDDVFKPIEELRTIYTTTNDLKKAIKQDLLKAYNTTDDLKGAYLKAGGSLDCWERDITNSYEDQNASTLGASEDALIDAYTFTLLTNEEQYKAIEKTLKADDYKQEEARRLSDLLLDGYKKCDYTK